MIIRKYLAGHTWAAFLLAVALTLPSAAQSDSDPFDCLVTIGELKYDLNGLAGEQTMSQERDTYPSRMRDSVRFNLCADLKKVDGVSEEDQCPSDTRACLTKTNLKGSQPERVISVIPLANHSRSAIDFDSIPAPQKGLSVTFKGPSYPSPITKELVPQSFSIRILCSTETASPQFKSYDGQEAQVEWSAPAGCAFGAPPGSPPGGEDPPSDGDGGGGEKEVEAVGSGVGYFFLLLFLAFIAYFALGAYYNYSTYGATGADLIPHRDFWREVPYMLRDVLEHLCSTVRPRHTSSRGGYIAV